MSMRVSGRLKLRLQLAFARFEWSYRIACVLCAAGAVGWLWGIPHLRGEIGVHQQATAHALEKLHETYADMIVLKSLKDEGACFGYVTNKITLLDRSGQSLVLPLQQKTEAATAIVNHILELKYVEVTA